MDPTSVLDSGSGAAIAATFLYSSSLAGLFLTGRITTKGACDARERKAKEAGLAQLVAMREDRDQWKAIAMTAIPAFQHSVSVTEHQLKPARRKT